MTRDLRDIVNKIVLVVDGDDPTLEEIAGLASDLATFFDASAALVYMGKMPLGLPAGPNQVGSSQLMAAAMSAIEEGGKRTLERMAGVLEAHGIKVSSQVVMNAGAATLRQIFEKEQADLIILPRWDSGVANRLARLISPSILEDATCPVLVLKGNRWLTESKAPRPSRAGVSGGNQETLSGS